ncbi:response regulator transcription factor [Lutibacter maritimus]|uniref:Regulatory protein, luxR family n=1 Tax=Lutibacter maritimus TaxID=593133 RepID=A0A1I6NRB8_9FLAO|nr:helix-turn-helix transcriptional regulator [Lutibacter maritimus]SFS30401.1 regulatory protein, luxR family [Lutibacter maritimus]
MRTHTLTKTEEQILQNTMQGFSNKEIASTRFRSVNTVITHCKRIKSKLNAKNMSHAILIYLGSIDNPKQIVQALMFLVIQSFIIFSENDFEMRRVNKIKTFRARTTNVRKSN